MHATNADLVIFVTMYTSPRSSRNELTWFILGRSD